MSENEGPNNEENQEQQATSEQPDASNQQIVQGLRWVAEQLVALKNDTESKFSALNGAAAHQEDPTTIPKIDPVPAQSLISNDDLERMSRNEFMSYMMDQIVTRIKTEVTDPIQGQMRQSEEDNDRKQIKSDINTAAESYNDFWDWKDEIKTVLDSKPNLSVDEAYHLSKGKYPQKQQALAEAASKKEQELKVQEEKTYDGEFGGLLPTSGTSRRSSSMDEGEAVKSAYDEVFAGTPFEKMLTN